MSSRYTWIQAHFQPKEPGSYLVTTAHRKIRIDRWDGEQWGLCRPRSEIKQRDKGRYKPHLAWMPLPTPAREEEL